MNYPKVFLYLSAGQAWWLYQVLRFIPGQTARNLRKTLGDLLKMLPK